MQYVYNMQNASSSLSPECQAHYSATGDSWKCIMAPYAAPFVATPWFALQSRFDKWQLGEELFMPCQQAQPYGPPYVTFCHVVSAVPAEAVQRGNNNNNNNNNNHALPAV
jgi:hypothetical protein